VSTTGDIVAIYIDNKPSIYARIEGIEPDIKPRWFTVRLLFLSFPPQEVSWILKSEYLDGVPFTMRDIPIRISALAPAGHFVPELERKGESPSHTTHPGEVISLDEMRSRRKKKTDE